MPFSGEFLGLLLLVASAAALGLSIVVDIGRLGAERARMLALQHKVDRKRVALKEWRARSGRHGAELESYHTRAANGLARRRRALAEIRAVEFGRIEMVHEVESDGAGTLYRSLLALRPDFAETDRRNIVFARPIWDFRNVAHIRATSPEQAILLVRAAFPQRCGVQPTTVESLDAVLSGRGAA
ncbi:hypothetical protein [Azospirillum halopraeferens]|uniref:hypothetical protein n=1 Tax=Azospirillum halopraeferens TaxID=34010 RepID=UPI0004074F50|nr:hypothetical protein [Azospirillum halopraeferens]